MNPKKDEYMRGYGDGFKDGAAAEQERLAAEIIDLNARLGISEGLKADARARAHELLDALQVLSANVEHAWPSLSNLGPLVQARAAIAKASS